MLFTIWMLEPYRQFRYLYRSNPYNTMAPVFYHLKFVILPRMFNLTLQIRLVDCPDILIGM